MRLHFKGFTGQITDTAGRKRYYVDGKPVKRQQYERAGHRHREDQSSQGVSIRHVIAAVMKPNPGGRDLVLLAEHLQNVPAATLRKIQARYGVQGAKNPVKDKLVSALLDHVRGGGPAVHAGRYREAFGVRPDKEMLSSKEGREKLNSHLERHAKGEDVISEVKGKKKGDVPAGSHWTEDLTKALVSYDAERRNTLEAKYKKHDSEMEWARQENKKTIDELKGLIAAHVAGNMQSAIKMVQLKNHLKPLEDLFQKSLAKRDKVVKEIGEHGRRAMVASLGKGGHLIKVVELPDTLPKNVRRVCEESWSYLHHIMSDGLDVEEPVSHSYSIKSYRDTYSNNTIRMSSGASGSVYMHEFGHHLERNVSGLAEKAKAFREKRIRGEVGVNLKERFGESFRDDEVGYKDDFGKLFEDEEDAYYTGKAYSFGDTEIISMGMQLLHDDPVRFARDDPEYFRFMMEAIRPDGKS